MLGLYGLALGFEKPDPVVDHVLGIDLILSDVLQLIIGEVVKNGDTKSLEDTLLKTGSSFNSEEVVPRPL